MVHSLDKRSCNSFQSASRADSNIIVYVLKCRQLTSTYKQFVNSLHGKMLRREKNDHCRYYRNPYENSLKDKTGFSKWCMNWTSGRSGKTTLTTYPSTFDLLLYVYTCLLIKEKKSITLGNFCGQINYPLSSVTCKWCTNVISDRATEMLVVIFYYIYVLLLYLCGEPESGRKSHI